MATRHEEDVFKQYPTTGAAPGVQNSLIFVHETLGLNVAPIDITGLLALLDDESLSGYTNEPNHAEEEQRIRGWTTGTIGGAIHSTNRYRYTVHGEKFSLEVDYNKVTNRNVENVKLESKGSQAGKSIAVTGKQLPASQSVSLLNKCAAIVARTTAKRNKEQQQKFDDLIASIVS